jgi:polyisoprenoid-binding protein YceI
MTQRRQPFLAALTTAFVLAAGAHGTAPPAAAEELALRLDPATTTVAFVLPATGHDVEGAFALSEGAVRFDPATGAASGRIVVDAKGARTGNESRDETMHEKVLESVRFPQFVFVPQRVEGTVPAAGKATLTLVGTMTMHGAEHPMRLACDVDVRDGKVHAIARFPVPFLAWGLHDPSIMFLRVEDTVQVTVDAHCSLGPAPTTVAGGTGGR